MAPRKRLTKKEIKHDPVIERTLQGWRYLTRHRNRAISVGMAVIALVVVVWGVSAYRASRKAEADTDFGRALLMLQTGERAKAVELLTEISAGRGGTNPGKRAAYYLAHIKFEDRDFAAARSLFDEFRRHRGIDDPFLKASAAKGVADCDAELGKLAEAGDGYLAVADRFGEVPVARDCLYLAGLALSKTADKARAIGALERLIEKYPEYGRIGDARILLGELQAQQRMLGLSS
ncbi:MAG: tetratricopeptide repeat protein [Candidatus Eisenbacteria bacterium]|nr:tetratricopeptide repeat protein [Candidatus Eisenbacteria bacterium]